MTGGERIGIGVPVWNGADHLGQALASLAAQDLGGFDVFVSDNASTDGTADVVRSFTRDLRIRYERQPANRGAAWNFNHVFEGTSAELFLWAAHDDRWHPTFLSRCVAALDTAPDAVLCHTAWQPIDQAGDPVGDHVPARSVTGDQRARWQQVQRDWTVHACIYGLVRRAPLARTGLLRAIVATDLLLVAELLLHGPIVTVDEVLHYKRVPAASESYRSQAEMMAYLTGGARRVGLPRLRVTAAELTALRRLDAPASSRLAMARDAVGAYVRQGYWAIDVRELGQRLLHRETSDA